VVGKSCGARFMRSVASSARMATEWCRESKKMCENQQKMPQSRHATTNARYVGSHVPGVAEEILKGFCVKCVSTVEVSYVRDKKTVVRGCGARIVEKRPR